MKEALCLFSGYRMYSRSQERLLRYLGGFPEGLEQAWDVPRDLSLPGLADAMGMVRSGLNQPLTGLLDGAYVTVRVAHVIGGGQSAKTSLPHHQERACLVGRTPCRSPRNDIQCAILNLVLGGP